MLFSEKLRMMRKGKSLTQEDLAEKLNVSRQAITKWESGEGTPDIKNLKEISKLFDQSIDELVKDELDITVKQEWKYNYFTELEIDHTKHFDINICKIHELNIQSIKEEKIKLEFLSNEEEQIENNFKVKFDDLYNRLDINVKCKKNIEDMTINLYLPEKYIDEIELKSNIKKLNIKDLDFNKIEYDGSLKYLDVLNSKGNITLNTTKNDIEATYDKLDGKLEVNTINSVARITLPKETTYKTVLKGIKNEFIDTINTEDSNNIIELNGINSKLIVINK